MLKLSYIIKVSLVLFALVLILFSTVNCGPEEDPNTVVLWTGMTTDEEISMLNELGDDFYKKEGIKVEVVQIPFYDLQTKFQIAAPAGQGPDLITSPQDQIGIFAAAELISSLDDYNLGDIKDDFLPVSIEGASCNNKLYAIPLTVETLALIYNKDIISEPPSTMEDIFEVSMGLTEKEGTSFTKYGFLVELTNFFYVYPFFSAKGVTVFGRNADGTINPKDLGGLSGEGSKEAIRLIYDLCEYGKYGIIPKDISGDKVMEKFITGKTAMVVNGPWAINQLEAWFEVDENTITSLKSKLSAEGLEKLKGLQNKRLSRRELTKALEKEEFSSEEIDMVFENITPDKEGMNYGVVPLPPFRDGGESKSFVGILGICLNRYSKNPDKAVKFMTFMNNKENQIKIYKALRRIPARISSLEDPQVKEDVNVQAFYKAAQNGVIIPNLPVMSGVWEPMNRALRLTVANKLDNPDTVINTELEGAIRRIKSNIDRLLR